ncbi:hypothetical protein BH11ARM2_BH11ARM2_10740 [soil metagenome]
MDSKRRPAVVISPVPYGNECDYLMCLMTATADPGEKNLLAISADDFDLGATYSGSGYIRPRLYLRWTDVSL